MKGVRREDEPQAERERERERERGGGEEGAGREEGREEGREAGREGRMAVVGWLLNVPATCQCISGTDLHRQFYVLTH